jgi:hypothetical protein
MISRHWKGVARPDQAGRYVDHLRNETFPKLAAIGGFIRASILTRTVERGVEFLVITDWESMDAVREFAGEAAEVAVVPPLVRALMVDYDAHVRHYEFAGEYRNG